jgi:hypothetical protein
LHTVRFYMIQEEVVCDKCGSVSGTAAENWEYCEGLKLQFCGECREKREEPPCGKSECQADVCYDANEERTV